MAVIEIIIPRRRKTRDAMSPKELDALYEEFLERAWALLQKAKTADGEWREDLHPRAPDGRFGDKPGQHAGKQERIKHHGLQPQEKPKAEDLKEKTAKGKLHELLASGHEWSKQELMELAGITNEKTFTSWLSMFKKPELSGGRKALIIVKTKEGKYRVAMPDGTPAPPKPTPVPKVEEPKVEKKEEPKPKPEEKPTEKKEEKPTAPTIADLKTAQQRWENLSVLQRTDLAREAGLPARVGEHGTMIGYVHWDNLEPAQQSAIASAVKKAGQPVARKPLPKAWKPAKTGKEATQRAVEEGWVTHADFGGVRAEDANAIVGSMADHLTEFPALRDQADNFYIGTNNGWKDAYTDILTKPMRERMLREGKTPEEIEKSLQYWGKARIKISSKAWATAWDVRASKTRAVAFAKGNITAAGSEEMTKALQRSVDSRWHPPGCNSIKSVMDHEMGHQMDYLLGLRSNPEIQALHAEARHVTNPSGVRLDNITHAYAAKQVMTQRVSAYAATNIAEFIAEAWAESKNNPEPRPIAKRLAEIVRSEYAKRFKKEA